jgi:hypothetical protein
MNSYQITLRYESVVTVTVDGENESAAIANAYEMAEDNFLGQWHIETVTKFDGQTKRETVTA